MKFKYYWKELLDDGKLIDGTYYSSYGRESISTYDGFETEAAALAKLKELSENPAYSLTIPHSLVLIQVYRPERVFK